jgi:integrase/recombinase XerD
MDEVSEHPHMPRLVPGMGVRLTLGHMTTTSVDDVVLRLAASAYLGRYTGTSRGHSESDLRIYLAWCAERDLAPLAVGRQQVMQEVRRFKPSTVSRRMAVVTGFYGTCVIDAVLDNSPAEYVRRPRVPNESPVLGLSHLQFEAILAAARESTNQFDFALVAMLGLLGLRISEASGADVDDLGEQHGHRVLLVHGKGGKETLVPLPPAVGRALEQAIDDRQTGPILLNRRDRRMDRHCATRRVHNLARTAIVRLPRLHPHLLSPDPPIELIDHSLDGLLIFS